VNILKALHHVLVAFVAILGCWIPVIAAAYDTIRGRGSLSECQRKEWHRWWIVYEEQRY